MTFSKQGVSLALAGDGNEVTQVQMVCTGRVSEGFDNPRGMAPKGDAN